jgi:hypothetical protein
MQNLNTDSSETRDLNPEEMEALRQRMLDYYTKQQPVLELQKVVENLSADIEEARLRRMVAAVRQAQVMAGPKDEAEEDEMPEAPPVKRSLKKDPSNG